VPTFAERGITGEFVNGWAGAFVATGTPQPIVDLLVEHASEVVRSPDFKQRIEKLGAQAASVSTTEFLATIREQRRTAAALAARMGPGPAAR
jgi:tripartite-type tricarboxylate transporter receptor subunit TctC